MSGFVFFQVFRWIQQRAPQRTNKENSIICRLVRVSLAISFLLNYDIDIDVLKIRHKRGTKTMLTNVN